MTHGQNKSVYHFLRKKELHKSTPVQEKITENRTLIGIANKFFSGRQAY
jgi:hypothetical protein